MDKIKVADVVYREDLYPRFEPNPALIQTYAACVEQLPPIEISQTNILIDGYHRLKAHESAGIGEIRCTVTTVDSEFQLELLAVERNSQHGAQLTPDEKKHYAVRWWDARPEAEILKALSISRSTYDRWTRDRKKKRAEELRKEIYRLWMRCETQEAIAEAAGVSRPAVTEEIANFVKNGHVTDSDIFHNFEPKLYSVWNFPEATNEVRHFGNIPPEIIDNLLYYFTKPFDVVFDPFGGGGSTIDRCIDRKRRYWVSDLTPIPERSHDMRQHDIITGLPEDLPVPDLVFLDPPYWKQAEGRYSDRESDLSNMELAAFLETISSIARDTKRKWTKGHTGQLALIIGPWSEAGEHTDLAFLCYERIKKYLNLERRIIVPYSTQVHGGAFVENAKKSKEILYLHRDLMVFSA